MAIGTHVHATFRIVTLIVAVLLCPHFSTQVEGAAQQDGFPLSALTAKCDPGYSWPFVGCQPWDGVPIQFETPRGVHRDTCTTTIPEAASSTAGCTVNVPFSAIVIVSIDPIDIPEGYSLEGDINQVFTIPDGPPTGVFGGSVFVLLPLESEKPVNPSSNQQSSLQDNPSSSTCTLVELRPGYPGFRGFVTGIAGLGEAACLEELESSYPQFSQDAEDSENLAAANRLGVAGTKDEWVWETWMAIHAERGLSPVCYVCIWTGNDPSPPPTLRVEVPMNDPRLLLSQWGTKEFAVSYANEFGFTIPVSPGGLGHGLPTDDELRALAALLEPARFPTANQLIAAASWWLAQYFANPFIPDYSYFSSTVIEEGGYFPGSGTMTFDDQFYLINHVLAMDYWQRSGALADPWLTAMQNRVGRYESDFLLAHANGTYSSYAEYVRAVANQS